MAVSQHVLAMADELRRMFDGGNREFVPMLHAQMQAAITEATAEQAATIAKQAARIAELEAMGSLIEEYGVICTENGMYDANQAECDAMLAEIKRILKGGA